VWLCEVGLPKCIGLGSTVQGIRLFGSKGFHYLRLLTKPNDSSVRVEQGARLVGGAKYPVLSRLRCFPAFLKSQPFIPHPTVEHHFVFSPLHYNQTLLQKTPCPRIVSSWSPLNRTDRVVSWAWPGPCSSAPLESFASAAPTLRTIGRRPCAPGTLHVEPPSASSRWASSLPSCRAEVPSAPNPLFLNGPRRPWLSVWLKFPERERELPKLGNWN
jgi:hypothetical protein